MKITLYKCDICGKQFSEDTKKLMRHNAGDLWIGRFRCNPVETDYSIPLTGPINTSEKSSDRPLALEDDLDICPYCKTNFDTFLKTMKGEISESVEVEK